MRWIWEPGREGRWLEALFRDSLQELTEAGRLEESLREVDGCWRPEKEGRLLVLAVGKAAPAMAATGARFFEASEQPLEGVVVSKESHGVAPFGWSQWEAGHPIPDLRSVQAAQQLLARVCGLQRQDRCVLLLSGGASSLLTAPCRGVSWTQKAKLTQELLWAGANIHEINCLRKHLSLLKGGGLLRQLLPARGVTLAISDVSGDLPASIASGISVPDPSTYADACEIMRKYGLDTRFSALQRILELGRVGELPETVKPSPRWDEQMPFRLLGSNTQWLKIVQTLAQARGLPTLHCKPPIDQTLEQVVSRVVALSERPHRSRPCLLLFGGEPTLKISSPGRGGRMQHLALRLAHTLQDRNDWRILAAGSDGTDGPTDAAGASIGPETIPHATRIGCDALKYLDNFDSYHFHQTSQTLFKTGPTGTNVNDLLMLLLLPVHPPPQPDR